MARAFLTLLMLGLCGAVVAWVQHPAEAGRTPKIGDFAPDFTLPDQDHRPLRLGDLRGKSNVVLAFYVKASTFG